MKRSAVVAPCHTDYLLPGEAGCLATPDNEYQENIEE